jgi:hypothetical protein
MNKLGEDIVAQFFQEYAGYIIAACGAIVWGIRLEGRVTENRNELERQRIQRDEDLRSANASRLEVHGMLAEMRSDIKTLLRGDR